MTRYDFMSEGVVQDDMSGSLYPDPLSLNYVNFQKNTSMKLPLQQDKDIIFLWLDMENFYGKPYWDDMVLTLNGVPHRNFLKTGDVLLIPEEKDIINTFNKRKNK